jgi:hypothetical protein
MLVTRDRGVGMILKAPRASLRCTPFRSAFVALLLAAMATAIVQPQASAAARPPAPLTSKTSAALPSAVSSPAGAAIKKLEREGRLPLPHKPSKTEVSKPCEAAGRGEAECLLLATPWPVKRSSGYALPDVAPALEGTGMLGGYSPKDLQSAYSIPTEGGEGQTVAVVNAFDDSTAESDLAKYREQYGLAPCTTANGCFRKVNQKGEEANYPEKDEGWGAEISLDLDMVSAACPKCHILLVEADSDSIEDLSTAVEKAAELGATEISNSYGVPETACAEHTCEEYFEAYDHPGVPVIAASGDWGYDNNMLGRFVPSFPASSPDVIAVGGTALSKAENARGWTESVWNELATWGLGTGGGCSKFAPKPAWQTDTGCAKRMGNDVSIVGACETPVSVYSTPAYGGWTDLCGTSAGAPLTAGILAHASAEVRSQGPEAFYRHKMFDVTEGSSGWCYNTRYLCTAQEGYDGPTGWGSPDGSLAAAPGFRATTDARPKVNGGHVTLAGYVSTEGAEATWHFEYGPNSLYGTSVPASEGKLAGASTPRAVSQEITLAPGAYHYRLVAKHGAETVYGADQTFTAEPWTVQQTPLPTAKNKLFFGEDSVLNVELESTSCSEAASCFAVGNYIYVTEEFLGEGLGYRVGTLPLSERWNGTEWSLQTVPLPSEAKVSSYNRLRGVSCASTTFCVGVGSYAVPGVIQYPLVERWNGTKWEVQAVPKPNESSGNNGILESVSCTSSTACVAVGSYFDTAKSGDRPFVERWNGTKWTLEKPSIPEGFQAAAFRGVSCTTSTACTAVGNVEDNSVGGLALAERWNGTKWEIQTTPVASEPKAPVGPYEGLAAVSCASATSCTAVGSAWRYREAEGVEVETSLAERWDGTKWTVQSVPTPAEAELPALFDVSCPSATQCTAVGSSHWLAGGRVATLVRWNGTAWNLESATIAEEAPNNEFAELLGVSCLATGKCTTVGVHSYYKYGFGSYIAPLAESSGFPSAETEAATYGSKNEPKLNASVNPNGIATQYQFEYGPTKSYGSTFPASAVSVGSGTTSVKVTQTISAGLEPNTFYHFRVVASNGDGVSYGADKTFTTGQPLRWYGCAKQGGGKYSSSTCNTEGAPNEWESLLLKAGEKTTIVAKGAPIAFTSTQSGIKTIFSCETEVASPSLENPSGSGNGVGNAEVKYKGCKPEGVAAEKGCKVENTANFASKLELTMVEGKARVLLKPSSGEVFAKFSVSSCSIGALNGTYELKGTMTGLYSNTSSKIEFTTETTGESSLTLRGQKTTAVGGVGLETSGGGYIKVDAVPQAITEAASGVKPTEATVEGTVNPNGITTQYQFEYGPTKSYGSTIPVSVVGVGAGTTPIKVAQTISGLVTGTQYHYRLVATNGFNTAYGADLTFTTTVLPLHWYACTKQSGGKYLGSTCDKKGYPYEWELTPPKEGEKTTVTAVGNPIAFSLTQSGLKTTFSCETEVVSASLENPSGGANGVGNAEVKYSEGCKPEGLAAEKGCKVVNTANFPSKLELATVKGQTQVVLTPSSGTVFAKFSFSSCAIPLFNGTYELKGTMRGLYSNTASQIEFNAETTAEGLTLRELKATAVGMVGLETSSGGYVRAE